MVSFFLMELALTIIAGLGALLFVISFLLYVLSGFKHHFVTGIISALPVLNIVTLPSLWDKSRGKFITGAVGLLIAIGAWFMGANVGIQNLIKIKSSKSVVLSTNPTSKKPVQINTTSISKPKSTTAPSLIQSSAFDESNMLGLPIKALYTMSFDIVPIDKISTLQGRIVQVTNNDNELIEGRIKSITNSSVFIEGLSENELPLATIKQLKLMVKKANK